jgi:peptidoglycan/xylan/chitin deacetylase (PgdA/CDA1 family)
MKMRAIDVPILMYHHVAAQDETAPGAYEIPLRQFEQELELIRKWRFQTINFYELLQILDGARPKRRRPVLITFDDAFRSFRELALPALKKQGMKATVFVPAGHIGGTNEWDRARGIPEHDIMSANELREIVAAGTEIGSHGWTHRDLTCCSESERDEEFVNSKSLLEKIVSQPVRVFSYPYGRYRKEYFSQVQAAGYKAAVSIFSNEPTVTTQRYAMRRIYIHPTDHRLRFRIKLSQPYLKYLAWRENPNGQSRNSQ